MAKDGSNKNGWISVKERLPEDGWPKLFYDDKRNKFGMCYYKDGRFYMIHDDARKSLMQDGWVTHWFDIPQPPVKDEFKNKRRG